LVLRYLGLYDNNICVKAYLELTWRKRSKAVCVLNDQNYDSKKEFFQVVSGKLSEH